MNLLGQSANIMGIFLVVCFGIPIVSSVFFHWKYVQSKISLITIQYAGGEIAFDTNWFSKEEIDDFQKQLRLAKDRMYMSSEKAMASSIQQAMQGSNNSSSADELVKYAKLYEQGLISQEEFEHFKRKLL